MTTAMNRLLVMSELFLPTKGGTAVWAAEVYKRLGGKEIHIVTADVPGASESMQSIRTPFTGSTFAAFGGCGESLAIYLRLFVKSMSLVAIHRRDAVHAFRALPRGLVAWAVARLIFRPVVIYAHGEELTGWGAAASTVRCQLRAAARRLGHREQ
jgi:phosphatidylinositol alpha-1,6-mannosyltransferase